MGIPSSNAWGGIVGTSAYILCGWTGTGTNFSAPPVAGADSLSTGMTNTSTPGAGAYGFATSYFGYYDWQAPETATGSLYLQNQAGTQVAGGGWFTSSTGPFVTVYCGSAFSGTITLVASDYDAAGRGGTVSDGTTSKTFLLSGSAGLQWQQWAETIAAGGSKTFTVTAVAGSSGQFALSGVFLDATAGASPAPMPGVAVSQAVNRAATFCKALRPKGVRDLWLPAT